jgi:hypothetical protein
MLLPAGSPSTLLTPATSPSSFFMVITQWPQEMFGMDSFIVSMSTPFIKRLALSMERITLVGQIVKPVEIV